MDLHENEPPLLDWSKRSRLSKERVVIPYGLQSNNSTRAMRGERKEDSTTSCGLGSTYRRYIKVECGGWKKSKQKCSPLRGKLLDVRIGLKIEIQRYLQRFNIESDCVEAV
uniref:Uncharacterized protein n=1 Tax=Cannabis sativa TaxID=3483 RepID=A0A803Q5C6_CANSA